MRVLLAVVLAVAPIATACGQAPSAPAGQIATASPAAGRAAVISARGRLIVSAKKDDAPGGVLKDPAHFQKRNYELSIAGEIARRLIGDPGRVELLLLPKPERIPSVENGDADLVISMIPASEENKKTIDLSTPYATGGMALMTRSGSGILKFEDLNGKRAAVAMEEQSDLRDAFSRIARERGLTIGVDAYPSFEDAAKAVGDGRAAALVSNSINITVYVAASAGQFLRVGGLLTSEQYAVGVRKGEAELLRVVNSVIEELRRTGELRKLAEKAGFPYELPDSGR